MCPIFPLFKNYITNYLEPKIYLEVPEWQDDKLEQELLIHILNVHAGAPVCISGNNGKIRGTASIQFARWSASQHVNENEQTRSC